ncbi:protein NETWORKED 2A-like [Zingiber officinale]|uniref:protein NETWORKED 2A-like n=1 Tax=Zingiber officinale TaxID=94328 RepID=UPI001C4CFB77|nr:protein NETWORKED 2A-like [Zingiber officinale]
MEQMEARDKAYSLWLASHIRDKQSKWLDNDLRVMEGKVQAMMKLIEQDADSFAKRAELYFQRRPELSSIVEEMHKSYKALADKFDRTSGQLHKANRTIATVSPEQVELAIEDDEGDCGYPKPNMSMEDGDERLELAEKIDELVDKAICLELKIASQTVQINRLSSEADELQEQIESLEEDQAGEPKNSLTEKLKQAKDRLKSIHQLEYCLNDDEEGTSPAQLTESCCSLDNVSESWQTPKHQEEFQQIEGTQTELLQEDSDSGVDDVLAELVEVDDDTDLPESLQNGSEDEQMVTLSKYTSILQNYEDTREMLSEIEKKNREYHLETMEQVKELKDSNAMKEEQIRLLKEILNTLKERLGGNVIKEMGKTSNKVAHDQKLHDSETGSPYAEDIKLYYVLESQNSSSVEGKCREQIDVLLQENMDFWLRFCSSYREIQEFQAKHKKLKADMEKWDEIRNHKGSPKTSFVAERLRKFNHKLQMWWEKNVQLNEELNCRISSLCSMQGQIEGASKESEIECVNLTPYQAAKLQGEVLSMQQQNKKVAKELQAGLDCVSGLQEEIATTLSKINDDHLEHPSSKIIPLRTFLFGPKPKKPSLFSCISPAHSRSKRVI